LSFQQASLGNEIEHTMKLLKSEITLSPKFQASLNFSRPGPREAKGVIAQGFIASERLVAVAPELYEPAMAGDHHADTGIMTGVNLGSHRAVREVQAFR